MILSGVGWLAQFSSGEAHRSNIGRGDPIDWPHLQRLAGQLESLTLPPFVTSLPGSRWSLTSLTATHAEARSISVLPPTLFNLNLRSSAVQTISSLPPRLRCLDLRYAKNIKNLPKLPPRLERLGINGALLGRLDGLPSSLTHLALFEGGEESLKRLPPNVESLAFEGAIHAHLEALPPGLVELRISRSFLPKLTALPTKLQSLALSGSNSLRSLKSLPGRIVSLKLQSWNQGRIEKWPPFVQSLHVVESPWSVSEVPLVSELETDELPKSLQSSQLPWLRALRLKAKPRKPLDLAEFSGLEELELQTSDSALWADLPHLRHFTLIETYRGRPKLGQLTELKSLSLALRSTPIAAWPPKLETLVLYLDTELGLEQLLPNALPAGLKRLTIVGLPSSVPSIPASVGLPEDLELLKLIDIDAQAWLPALSKLQGLKVLQVNRPSTSLLQQVPPKLTRLILRGDEPGQGLSLCAEP